MKKKLSFLVLIVLAICMVGFAFDRMVPASPVHAAIEAGDVSQRLGSAEPADQEAVPLAQTAHPVVIVVTGLVSVLFGIIAISPLLVDDPAKL